MGENTLGTMMSKMAKKAGLVGKITNHSLRRTSLTTLMQAGVPPTIVAQLSGHKNVGSLSRYTTASLQQQRMMSEILQKKRKFVNKSTKSVENKRQALNNISNFPVASSSHSPLVDSNALAEMSPANLRAPSRPTNAVQNHPTDPISFQSLTTHQLSTGMFYGATIGSIGTININITK